MGRTEPIDPRLLGQELGLVPLDEAAGDDHPAALSVVLEPHGVLDLGHRLGLGGLEEAAGVNDDRVRRRRVRRDRQSILGQQAEHPLAVDEVLGAAEADEGDGLDRLVGRFFDLLLFGCSCGHGDV